MITLALPEDEWEELGKIELRPDGEEGHENEEEEAWPTLKLHLPFVFCKYLSISSGGTEEETG